MIYDDGIVRIEGAGGIVRTGQMSIWRIKIFGQSGDTTSVNLANIFERVDNVANPEEQSVKQSFF